jgi:hypothetical protein
MEIIIPSSFCKAGVNVKDGDIVDLITEGEWKEIKGVDGKTKKVLQFEMRLPNKEIKTYTMNNTTIRTLSESLGTDSREWMNIPLRATIIEMLAFGKKTDVLTLVPMDQDVKIPVIEEESDEL